VRGKNIEVTGESQVITVSDPKNLKINPQGLIQMQDMRFGLYADGDNFSIR
jgi:cyanophycinase